MPQRYFIYQHGRVWERARNRFDGWSLGRLLDLRAMPLNGHMTLEFPLGVVPDIGVRAGATEVFYLSALSCMREGV